MRTLAALLTSDRLAALVLIAVFVAYGLTGGAIPPALEADVVGPGFFPRIIAVMGALLAFVLFVQSKPEEKRMRFEIDRSALMPVAALLAYGLTLEAAGFPLATLVFLAWTFRYLGCPRWWRALLLAVAATAATIGLFHYGLDLQLPRGTLLPWSMP